MFCVFLDFLILEEEEAGWLNKRWIPFKGYGKEVTKGIFEKLSFIIFEVVGKNAKFLKIKK